MREWSSCDIVFNVTTAPIDTAFWVHDYIILDYQLLFGSSNIVYLLENFVNGNSLGKWEGTKNHVGEHA